ncbi:MAG: nodulation protein NfeD [Nitrospinae bacterium]|nr:nodulation protein NfeD [Nitrospinota bacterium]
MDLLRQVVTGFIISSLFCLFPDWAQATGRIVVLKVSGPITPAVADYLSQEIQTANTEREALVVIEMDTPGGLDASMRVIIKAIQNSDVPVATYVYPSGSRAASAGTFIAIASHIAAMAPGTNIGAAHPVNMLGGGGGSGDGPQKAMEEKITNDAAAYIRSLAEMRGRNAYWAELAVRKSVSISAEEARKLAVIDLVAADLDALILAADGREVRLNTKTATLKTRDREIVVREMSKRQRVLDIISDPNVAYVLLMLGLVGLYFELSNPGLILPGVIGGISLVLALYAMHTLPINYAGLLLIFLGLVMFVAELSVASYGLLSVGGIVALLLGSLMLIDSPDPAMQISRRILYPMTAFAAFIAAAAIYLAARTRALRPVSGAEGLVGARGVVKADLDPVGSVLVHGETWTAEGGGAIKAGETVVVQSVDGLKVKVGKIEKE